MGKSSQDSLWHQSESGDKVLEYILSPYFIEPYAIGQTTHIIGRAQMVSEVGGFTREKMYTFKIERIRRAEMTHEPYQLPHDFAQYVGGCLGHLVYGRRTGEEGISGIER